VKACSDARRQPKIEIVPHIHLIPGVSATPYLLIDPAGLTLIDTGMPGSDRKILRYLASLGFAAGDLKRIFITHADVDHTGSLAALKAASGARLYAHANESEAIAAGRASREINPENLALKLVIRVATRFYRSAPAQVDEFVTDGQVFPVLGGLQVIETIGHTPGHISLFAPAVGALFVGDSLVSDAKGLSGSRKVATWDQAQAQAAVQKQATLGARIVCPGHGPVVMEAQGKFPLA
jgi:glyoxylase-like metal-dependent hydrolase (beta-lactamase superfamily II)